MAAPQADTRFGRHGRPVVPAPSPEAPQNAREVEQRLHKRFRQIEGRSLAEELIRERRAEARRESLP